MGAAKRGRHKCRGLPHTMGDESYFAGDGKIRAHSLARAAVFAPSCGCRHRFCAAKSKEAEARTVVRVWNIDTFEGGKGSRTAFLKSVARELQGEAYYLVTSYTLEGALSAFAEGEAPDVLSFGVGLSEFAERLLPLPYSFAGGELGGKTLAYPWCMGGYYLFSLTDFEGEGRTALSVGGENLPAVAARLEGITGEETESVAAYTGFLSGKYRYLLGTQRDVCRFQARGVSVQARPLTKYCDLYQYIGILSAEKREASLPLWKRCSPRSAGAAFSDRDVPA